MGMQIPNKFAGAMDFTITIAHEGAEYQLWVGVPLVTPACPHCDQAVNASGNQFVRRGEIDFNQGVVSGGVRCSNCKAEINETTCYCHANQRAAPLTFIALCILSDENPLDVVNRNFTPGAFVEPGVFIAKGAQIGENVRFVAPVLVNNDCVIRSQCEIGPFVYLEDAKVEQENISLANCDVRRSVVKRSLEVATVHDTYLG